jgi:ferric-dicitrate binding protein FerR (iron transport regulator)
MEPTKVDHHEDRNDAVAALIGRAGPRAQPAAPLEDSVRAAVYEEWQRSLRSKRQQRVIGGLLAAAVIIICVGIGWRVSVQRPISVPVAVASVVYAHGAVHVSSKQSASSNAQAALYVGDDISTDTDAGARLLLSNQASLRLAGNSHLRWRTSNDIELLDGAVYVDSGPQHARFVVRTRYGEVTHLGTRYQVKLSADALGIAVRDGVVNLQTDKVKASATTQQKLKVDNNGQIAIANVSSYGEEWAWIDSLAPSFDIDNRSVDEFLHWAAHETGHTLEYVDDASRVAATRTVLHGSVGVLAPARAIAAVLPTTDFNARFADGHLLVSKH